MKEVDAMEIYGEVGIEQVAKREVAKPAKRYEIQNVRVADLANQAVIDDICVQAVEAAKAEKAAKDGYTAIKDNAKRLFAERFGDNVKGVMYSPENGLKIEQTVRGEGGVGIDQDKFLDALFDFYGEEKYDKTGRAWAAFKRVSVEVECPRVIDPAMFDAMLREEQSIAAGISDEPSEIPLSVFEACAVEKKPTVAVSAKKMSKAELAEYRKSPQDFDTVIGG